MSKVTTYVYKGFKYNRASTQDIKDSHPKCEECCHVNQAKIRMMHGIEKAALDYAKSVGLPARISVSAVIAQSSDGIISDYTVDVTVKCDR